MVIRMAHFVTKITQKTGMPLGGLGTGTVELRPDGELHAWQIANEPRWSTVCREAKVEDGERFTGSLAFFLRCETRDGRVTFRRLGLSADPEEFTHRMYPMVRPVETVDFSMAFPEARVKYLDNALPCRVEGRFTAPFVPHDETAFATPAFRVNFVLDNPGGQTVQASVVALLKTPFCNYRGEAWHWEEIEGVSVATAVPAGEKDASAGDPAKEPSAKEPWKGSVCLAMEGKGEGSHLVGEYACFLDEYVSHSDFGITQESFFFDLIKTGRLPDTVAEEALTDLSAFGGTDPLTVEDWERAEGSSVEALWEQGRSYAFGRSLLTRLATVYPGFGEKEEDRRAFCRVLTRQVRDMTRARKEKPFGGAALCRSFSLAPGESGSVSLVFSWFFPNHRKENGEKIGHIYENFYKDAREVALRARKEAWFDRASSFAALLSDTDRDPRFADAWQNQLSTLVKDSLYTRDGRFGLWEGLGYCGYETTDITYHASFAVAALFPRLQAARMKNTAAFQRADGRMPHFFTPDLDHVDDGFHRVDLNPQFVLLVARDYLLTGDRAQVGALWPGITRAMEATGALDRDGDGLPDTGTGASTYDAWHMRGTPAYLTFLWLGALTAAIRLSFVTEDGEHRLRWQELLAKGSASAEKRLWNGAYYDLWVDCPSAEPDGGASDGRMSGLIKDGAHMSDQLDGAGFLKLIGLEPPVPAVRLAQVAEEIYRHNFIPGRGLVNATFPPEKRPTVYTYGNCQAEAMWSGIAYWFAALEASLGREDRALALVASVEESQRVTGYFMDHWECGFRYTRPLSSWALLLALSGVTFDAGEGLLSLLPPGKDVTRRLPLVTATGCGQVIFTPASFRLTVWEGQISFARLRLPFAGAPVETMGEWQRVEEGVEGRFDSPLTLTEGESLSLTFA